MYDCTPVNSVLFAFIIEFQHAFFFFAFFEFLFLAFPFVLTTVFTVALYSHSHCFFPFAVVLQSLLKLVRFSYFQTTNFSYFIVSILFELPTSFPLRPTKRFNRIPSDLLFSLTLTVSFLPVFQHKLVKYLCILFLLHQLYRIPYKTNGTKRKIAFLLKAIWFTGTNRNHVKRIIRFWNGIASFTEFVKTLSLCFWFRTAWTTRIHLCIFSWFCIHSQVHIFKRVFVCSESGSMLRIAKCKLRYCISMKQKYVALANDSQKNKNKSLGSHPNKNDLMNAQIMSKEKTKSW